MASQLYTISPDGTLQLDMHEGQLRLWDSRSRFIFGFAGTQGGKTSWSPFWLYREVYGGVIGPNEDPWPGRGSGDYLAVTSSYDLFKLKFLPAMREVFETVFRAGRYWAGDRIIELADPETGKFHSDTERSKMWGRIILRSAASGGGLESSTAKAAVMDECGQDEFGYSSWEAIQRRLSIAQGRALGITTIYNAGWTKSEVYDRWQKGDKTFDVVQFDSIVNPSFPKAEFERAQGSIQDHRFLMFYRGRFARPPGLIYNKFDSDRHVVKPFPIPPWWPRIGGIDYGGANNCILWAAEAPNGKLYVYRERLEGGITTREHAVKALADTSDDTKGPRRSVTWWGGSVSETQQRRDWSEYGLHAYEPPIADVESGIDRVQSGWAENKVYIFDTCPHLIDQIGTYRRVEVDGEPTDEILNKRRFHYCDALRYLVVGWMAADSPESSDMAEVPESDEMEEPAWQ